MELSLEGSGISYEPGDVIGVRCPNPVEATAYILERLQVSCPFHHMTNISKFFFRGMDYPYTGSFKSRVYCRILTVVVMRLVWKTDTLSINLCLGRPKKEI